MLRKLIFQVLPFLLPFVLYGLYWLIAKRREQEGLSQVPWLVLVSSGLALTIVSLAVLSFMGGAEPGLTYTAPHEVDGVIVPGRSD